MEELLSRLFGVSLLLYLFLVPLNLNDPIELDDFLLLLTLHEVCHIHVFLLEKFLISKPCDCLVQALVWDQVFEMDIQLTTAWYGAQSFVTRDQGVLKTHLTAVTVAARRQERVRHEMLA